MIAHALYDRGGGCRRCGGVTEGGAAAAAERQPSALVNQRSTLATHDRSRTLPIISDGDAGQSVLNAPPSASLVLFVPGCDDEGPSSCVRRKNRR